MALPQKGDNTITKVKNMPVIIISNYDINNCYSKANPSVVTALKNRFFEFQVPNEGIFDLEFIEQEDPATVLTTNEIIEVSSEDDSFNLFQELL